MPLPEASEISAILLDIEGTTTRLEFVSQVLFPYAGRNVERFLRRNIDDRDVRSMVDGLKKQHQSDSSAGLGVPSWNDDSEDERISAAATYCNWLMEHDSKISPLKALQGRIWQEGYKKGELRGEVYPDVPPALKRWREDGKRIYIYSSGSVLAQKLLFESTAYGDLTQLLDGYVDTKVGSKMDPASYIKIAAQIGCETGQVLFVSDAVRELEAAQSAGLQVALAVRATDEAASPSFVEIHSFSDIFPD